jgi:N-acetylmuramoyl-L-alanine amidase
MMHRLGLSASQQSWNQFAGGATGTGDSEEHWMEHVAARVHVRIEAQHWTDVKVFSIDKGSYEANVAESNRLKTTEHLGIHTNAGGGHGTELLYKKGSPKSKALATALYPFVASASNMPDRGIKSSSTLGELNGPHGTPVIMELLFHDNAKEAEEMRHSVNEFAEAVVKGIARYYGYKYKA